MKRLQFIMADADAAYMESVAAYLRTSHHAAKFDLKLFTAKEPLQAYLESEDRCDILLMSPQFLPLPDNHNGTPILLDDDRIPEIEIDYPTVFKYQPLNQLFAEILGIYYEQHGKAAQFTSEKSRTQVLSVYSATGGTGKTTLAVNLSKRLALENQKVFYLNLELLHSTPLFFTSHEPQPSSQILYYAKANPEQLIAKVESLKAFDPYTQVDFFDFPVCAEEMSAISLEEAGSIVSSIVETEHYDVLIIDLDASFSNRARAALQYSDQIFWLLNNDLQSFHKSSALLKESDKLFGDEANIRDKITFVLNKYTGAFSEQFNQYDLSVKHYLPYVPEWKNVVQASQLMNSTIYSDALSPLLQKEPGSQRGVPVD